MTLDYTEFVGEVRSRLSSRFSEDTHYEIRTIIKNNDSKLDGLIISRDGDTVSPTLYLESYFSDYKAGLSVDDICDNIIGTYESNRIKDDFDPAFFSDFEQVSSQITYRLINASMNEELLSDVPHIPYHDLAITFCVSVDINDDISGSILIHDNHMKIWGVGVRDLMKCAEVNTAKLYPPEVISMAEALKEYISDVEEQMLECCPMTVLSNRERSYGASVILYPGLLQDLGEVFEEDYYILPSSIHELILLPASYVSEPDALKNIIGDVNTHAVPRESLLSDHAYLYKRADNCIISQ